MSDDFAQQRVLITGATGFIGGHVARRLARENAAVRALARNPSRAEALSRAGIDVVPGDMCDPDSLAAAVQGCAWVLHFAAIVREVQPLRVYRAVNVEGTRALAEAALAAGVRRFVYASTIGVYGARPARGTDETGAEVPSGDPYSDTKLEAEQVVRRLVAEGRLPAVVVQPAITYGPDDDVMTLGPLAQMRAGTMILAGDGRALLQPIYVDDLVDGILAAARRGRTGERYILCGPEVITFREYFGELARLAGRTRLRSMPVWAARALTGAGMCFSRVTGRPARTTLSQLLWVTTSRTFSGRKAEEELGFRATTDLKTGMRRVEKSLQRRK